MEDPLANPCAPLTEPAKSPEPSADGRPASESGGLTDAAIIARVLAGDGALYELVMRRHNRLLFRLARSIVPDDDEARDVVQATYVRAYYGLSQLRCHDDLKSWLARIAINEANGRRRHASPLVDEERVLAMPDLNAIDPEIAASGGDMLRILQAAIDRLPDEFRTVFMLRGVEQRSVAETAELLDVKPATVKSRYHRARRLLQTSLYRKFDAATRDTYPFGGDRCDETVAAVFARIGRGYEDEAHRREPNALI
jgi:RNA polymerase sigma-70 factor (ECF subfamily)